MKKKNSRHVAPNRKRLTRKRTHSMSSLSPEENEDNTEGAAIESPGSINLQNDKTETEPMNGGVVDIDKAFEEGTLQKKEVVVKSISLDENGNYEDKADKRILTVTLVHDHNNNATDRSESDTHLEEMSGDENSPQNLHDMSCSTKTSSVAACEEKGDIYEDSMCSNDPGDRVINTNLYGTDVDPNYQSPTVSLDRITREPTAPPQQQYESPAGPQTLPGAPSHLSTPPSHNGPAQSEQAESSMSVSNQETKETSQTWLEPGHTRTETKLTSFGGIFKQASAVLGEDSPQERSCLPQTFPQQSYEPQAEQGTYPEHSLTTRPEQHGMEDSNMAAEQLASELVKNYGGRNSEMISEILKPAGSQQFVCADFARHSQEDLSQYADGSQNVLHDVDLLNTPQQLSLVDELYHHHGSTFGPGAAGHGHQKQHLGTFGSPQACSTPDRLNRSLNTPQTNLEGSYTCNDVQLHGVKWTAGKNSYNSNNNQGFECSENPCEPSRGPIRQAYPSNNQFALPKSPSPQIPTPQSLNLPNFPMYQSPDPSRHTRTGSSYFSPGDYHGAGLPPSDSSHYRSSRPISHERVESYCRPTGPGGPGMLGQGNMDYSRQGTGEITKMTFTPRQMMESHLSQVNQRLDPATRGQHAMSEMDYSSIYPKREFIERMGMGQTQTATRDQSQTRMTQGINAPPKKRHKMSSCESPLLPQAPPPMPIIDDMFAKNPPVPYGKEMNNNYSSSRQKYHVLNPSEATNMTSKALLCKYVDFLILENEQITEISKSISPPVDIYVTEDMYFMDSLKYRVPFPSKKLTEWVSSFYPKLNFWQMKFKNQKPKVHPESTHRMMDSRPTQQILEDTFYFFQREIMNYEGQ